MPERTSYLKIAVVMLLLTQGALLTYLFVRPSPEGASAAGSGTAPPAELVAAEPRAVTDRGELAADEDHIVKLFEQSSPSVVFITTLGAVRGPRGYGGQLEPQGAGTGFMWDDAGHIVTNFHVIAEASEAVVTLSDGSELPAKLVGAAPDQDLAVLKIEAPAAKLKPLPLGSSKDLKVGQFAMAIGNPFGLDHTLTTGIISALDRDMQAMSGRTIYGVVQTDAAINPGNSGGPLLDSAGRLIGVNSAIQSASGSSAGIGFAVPVDTVNRIVPQLIKNGRAQRPGLGVVLAGAGVAEHFGVSGAVVREVSPGSPAEKAGIAGLEEDRFGRIRLGDVITGIDGANVKDLSDLLKRLDQKSIGDEVEVTLLRDGATRSARMTLFGLE